MEQFIDTQALIFSALLANTVFQILILVTMYRNHTKGKKLMWVLLVPTTLAIVATLGY